MYAEDGPDRGNARAISESVYMFLGSLSTRYSALPPVIKDACAALRTTILEETLIVDSEMSVTGGEVGPA